jgi:hypothetical protein
MAHEPIHCLVYGDSGAGKSTFAATFPKPMLVFAFDPRGKETPYLNRGEATGFGIDDQGSPYREVLSRKSGDAIVRLEYYLDAEPERPDGYARFGKRLLALQGEYDKWQTIVVDSVTFMELTARKYHQYVLNKTSKEPRQWFAGSTDALEEVLMIRFGSLPMNVVVIAHVDEEKDELHGTFVRNPKAPGRLRRGASAGYSEFYRAFVKFTDANVRQYVLQTRSDRMWNAASQIGAPDPCDPVYQALWSSAPEGR